MLELYHDWDSVHSYKVRAALAEKGVAWESRRVALLAFENLQPDYLKLNPNGVVPTVVHDGKTIFESTVIVEYIDEAFPGPALRPADAAGRADMRMWMKFQDDVLYNAQRPATFNLMVKQRLASLSDAEIQGLVARHPSPQRAQHFLTWARGPIDEKVVAEARQNIDGVFARLETRLANAAWLAGSTFSLADLAYMAFIERIEILGFAESWTKRPGTARWAAALKARPSFARACAPAEFRMPAPKRAA